jgi:prolyl oligopeptidase
LRETLKASYDYEKIGCPGLYGTQYYFYYNSGVQQQSVLYRCANIGDYARREVVLDPNVLSEDGTTGIGCSGFSESARYYAYGLSTKGTDWRQVFVKDLTTLNNLPDVINWVKFSSITWTHDDLGFFYCRYQPPPGHEGGMTGKAGSETDSNRNQKLCYHKLGAPESEDKVIMEDPVNDKWMFGASVTDDGKYVIISTHESCAPMNLVQIGAYNGNASEIRFTPVISKWEWEYSYLCNDGPVFYFITNQNASKKKIVSMTFVEGATDFQWVDVVKEDEKRVMSSAAVMHQTLLVVYMEDVVERLYIGTLKDPTLVEVPLPTLGSIAAMKCERYKDWLFLKLTSYTTPGLILSGTISASNGAAVPTFTTWNEEKVNNLESKNFTARQMFYRNETDKTRIPLFVLSPAGCEGETLPCILYGYGGFNIAMTPGFSTFRLTFVQRFKAHYAVACIRGGDEYGEEWHVNGSRAKKQNSLNDFQYAARFLIDMKLTTASQLGILGGSNGGLLVAACANQAPELYAAVVAQVGVLDMYRFHKFTIGAAWMSEYGDPAVAEDFAILKKYSPLHNIRKDVKYPNIMCMTGDHDDRVVPLHTFKYISTLQHLNPPGGKYFARIEISVGHGATSPTAKRIEETADLYAFMANAIGATWH